MGGFGNYFRHGEMVFAMVKKRSWRVKTGPHPYCWQDRGKSTNRDPHTCLTFRSQANTIIK